MAKQPLIGRVKTRLARDIGHAEALRFFRSASESLIRRVGRDPCRDGRSRALRATLRQACKVARVAYVVAAQRAG